MRFLRPVFLIPVLLFFSAGFLGAQGNESPIKVKAAWDKDKATIGEKINYTITVVTGKDTEIEFPDIYKLFQDFTVRDSGSASRTLFGKKTVSQRYILQGYTPGKYTIPQAPVKYKIKGQSGWSQEDIPGFVIEVKSALEEGAALRDIKGPLSLRRNLKVLFILALAALLAILGFIFKSLSKEKESPQASPKKPAHEIAYEQLEDLSKKDLIRQGRLKEYYSEISDIIRRYLENRFLLKAPEMTTEEFLLYVRDYASLPASPAADAADISQHKNLLKEFLSSCDLVKFAKYTPSLEEIEGIVLSARKFVDATKEEAVLK